jgi:hypothetical protein
VILEKWNALPHFKYARKATPSGVVKNGEQNFMDLVINSPYNTLVLPTVAVAAHNNEYTSDFTPLKTKPLAVN